jgi:hypothetical protein
MKPAATVVLVGCSPARGGGRLDPRQCGGKAGLFAGAVVGGATLACLSPLLCARLGWIAGAARRGASFGALLGVLVAAPTAATNLRTPVVPVLVCTLAGVGAVIGGRRDSQRR